MGTWRGLLAGVVAAVATVTTSASSGGAVAVSPAPPQQLVASRSVNNPALDTTEDTSQVGTSLAVDGSNVVVGWLDAARHAVGQDAGYARSVNGGASFADRGSLPASAYGDRGVPSLAADTIGHRVYAAAAGATDPSSLPVSVSVNGGGTFRAPVDAVPALDPGSTVDAPSITVDTYPGTGAQNVYLCWTRYTGGQSFIDVNRSTRLGRSFVSGTGVAVSTGGNGCQVLVAPDHTVHVFYFRGDAPDGQSGDNKLYVRRSVDRGATFQPEVVVADLATTSHNGDLGLRTGKPTASFPAAAVSPVTGRLYVAFNDDPPGNDVPTVYYTHSANGTTWTAPQRATDGGLDPVQYQPSIAVSPDGQRLFLGHYRIDDSYKAIVHRRGRLATIRSTGSLMWDASFRLGPDTADFSEPTAQTGRDGVAATAGAFHSVWADSRTGDAFHSYQSDIQYARIDDTQAAVQLEVVLAAPASARVGQTVTVQASVTNHGAETAQDVFLTIDPLGTVRSTAGSDRTQCHDYDQR